MKKFLLIACVFLLGAGVGAGVTYMMMPSQNTEMLKEGEMPEGMMPMDGEMPEGMERPEGMTGERPEGMTGERPEGMTGEMPEGMERPEGMMPQAQ